MEDTNTVCKDKNTEIITCTSCGGGGTLTTLLISIPNQQKQVINTFECTPCNIRESSVLAYIDKDERGGIRIDCHFTLHENRKMPLKESHDNTPTGTLTNYNLRKNESSVDPRKSDLSRYILLSPNSTVCFEKEDFSYTYTCSKDTYTCLELIIRNIMKEIKGIYGLKLKDQSVYNPDDESSLLSMESINENKQEKIGDETSTSLSTLEEKQSARSAIIAFDSFLRDLNFKMTILDESGFSRVFPINQNKNEKEINDEDFFKLDQDVDVVHTWYEREEE